MALLKSDLKISAGLLKEAAPENHLLAYITPGERNMLVDAGGVKTPTESGIFAYPPLGQAGTSPGTTTSGGSAYSGGNNNGGAGSQFTSGGNISPGTDVKGNVRNDNPFTGDNSNDDIDSTYTDTSFDVTPEPVEKNFFEKVVDFVKGGGIIGSVIKSIGGKLNPENKYEGITGEDGIGEGDYISTQGDWAASKGYVDESAEYYALDLEEQQAIDKLMFDDGVRSQAFNDLYNDGDTSNLDNLTSTERNEINKIIPNLPDAIGGTTPQESQAAKWYNSIGNNTQQFNFATAYANAKTKVSQQLNNKGPIGMLAVNDSPYYDWLKTKGLDRGIL